jgi:hypothetical protein
VTSNNLGLFLFGEIKLASMAPGEFLDIRTAYGSFSIPSRLQSGFREAFLFPEKPLPHCLIGAVRFAMMVVLGKTDRSGFLYSEFLSNSSLFHLSLLVCVTCVSAGVECREAACLGVG